MEGGSPMRKPRPTGQSGEAATEAGAIKDLIPFQPTTSRAFAATDTVRVFAHAFWGSKDQAVSVTLNLSGPSKSSPQVITLNGSPNPSGRSEATLDTTLPLSGLAPGRYQLEVAARLPNKQMARRILPFEVR